MFYSHDILAQKGPLGTIWIAAHLDRKLRKNQVLDTDIGISVEAILSADLQKVLALRLSGHLLLGVTRIFNRKVAYLYGDCNEALLKLKQVYRPGNVDLPQDQAIAPSKEIDLPPVFELPSLDDPGAFLTPVVSGKKDRNRAPREDITLLNRVEDETPFTFNDDDIVHPTPGGIDPFNDAYDYQTPEKARDAPMGGQVDDDYLPPFEGGFDIMDMDVEKNRDFVQEEQAQEKRASLSIDLPTPLEKGPEDTELLPEEGGLGDLTTQPTPSQGRDSLDDILNGGNLLPTPLGEDILSPTAEPGKPTPKRRKVSAGDRVIIDGRTTIEGTVMEERIKNPANLVKARKRAAHTERQLRVHVNARLGVESLMRTPAVGGLGRELQVVIQRMLVKSKPDSVPLTEEARERLASTKKQKVAEEEAGIAPQTEEGAPEESAAAEPTQQNGDASTPHGESFPAGGDDFPPPEDHFDTPMPDGDWDAGNTAPYPTPNPGGKGEHAAGLSGLEDLLTGKTPGGGEDASEIAEEETPSQDESASQGVKGWSVRTKGVANRLQQVFQEKGMEESVPLDGLLGGYGRRTAAKMFFEVLVLKTSNFIDVKQESPYGNVDLLPTPQLMTTAF